MAESTSLRIPNVLSIAGLDPSGGAGILADVKAMSALGAYGMAVTVALTAQNTRAVTAVMPLPVDFVVKEIDTVFEDVRVDAVKIGMLGTPELVEAVAEALFRWKPANVVLDPVMVAKSGDRLLAEAAVRALKETLLPLADVVTPNLPEAGVILGRELRDREAMPEAAQEIAAMMKPGAAVLLKGGHLENTTRLTDVLFDNGTCEAFEGELVKTRNTHGTGCTLSSAVATLLGKGLSRRDAVAQALRYVHEAILAADRLEVGSGHGPTHHFHAFFP